MVLSDYFMYALLTKLHVHTIYDLFSGLIKPHLIASYIVHLFFSQIPHFFGFSVHSSFLVFFFFQYFCKVSSKLMQFI